MNYQRRAIRLMLDELDCFGDYSKTNPLCAKHCVLRLRCAIEQEQNMRMELLSELTTTEGVVIA